MPGGAFYDDVFDQDKIVLQIYVSYAQKIENDCSFHRSFVRSLNLLELYCIISISIHMYEYIYIFLYLYIHTYIYIYNFNYKVIGMKSIMNVCQSSSFSDTVHISTFTIWNKIFLTLFYYCVCVCVCVRARARVRIYVCVFLSLFTVIMSNFCTCNRSFPHYYRLNLRPKRQKVLFFKMADGSSKWTRI